MSEDPQSLVLPSSPLIMELESRQDEVLRDLDELIARLESVLAAYSVPAVPAVATSKAA